MSQHLNDRSFGLRCAQCLTETEVIAHHWHTGTPERPSKRWSYVAPLYHSVEGEVGFCGPQCSVTWYQARKDQSNAG